MSVFCEMFNKVTASHYHNKMMRFVEPLSDYLGVNHFWYYKITNGGYYSYFGTHVDWSEHCFNENLVATFPSLRHPNLFKNKITLMKASDDIAYSDVLKLAWNKFKINFNVNILKKLPDGVEAFGFATRFNDVKADERLLNQLPLLDRFTQTFRAENKKIFELLEDCQIDISSEFGSLFYEQPKEVSLPFNRDCFLEAIGLGVPSMLTVREIDILKFIAYGHSASYISQRVHLSRRTVEAYIAILKEKLFCSTKSELIQKAHDIISINFF